MGRHFLFLLFSLALSSRAASAEKAAIFYPHLSAPAATVGSGGITFQAFPGANGLQGMFLNALDVGITDYVEVGTAPIFYLISEHRYNYNAKLNFLKLRYLHLGAGYSYVAYRTSGTMPDGSPAIVADYQFQYWFGAANIFLSEAVGIGINVLKPKLKSDMPGFTEGVRYNDKGEWFVDFSFRVAQELAFSPGFGVLRLDTLDPNSPVPFGYGASLTWIRKKTGMLNKISFGLHHMPEVKQSKVLFSFSVW